MLNYAIFYINVYICTILAKRPLFPRCISVLVDVLPSFVAGYPRGTHPLPSFRMTVQSTFSQFFFLFIFFYFSVNHLVIHILCILCFYFLFISFVFFPIPVYIFICFVHMVFFLIVHCFVLTGATAL